MAVPSVILATDNIPRFSQISLEDYTMDIEDALKKVTPRTAMIIPIHTYGYQCDAKQLRENLTSDALIVEDAAMSLLTDNVGAYGDATLYSLGLYKQLYSFDGGVITTNRPDLHDNLREYRSQQFKKSAKNAVFRKYIKFLCSYLLSNPYLYEGYNVWGRYKRHIFYTRDFDAPHLESDTFSMLSRFQAAIGLAQLRKAQEIVDRRRKIAAYYQDKLLALPGLTCPPQRKGASYSEYTIRLKNRDAFEHYMNRQGILINTLFSYSVPYLQTFKGYATEHYPNSLQAASTVVNLPSYPGLLNKQRTLDRIIEAVTQYI
jgi:perosamine synthetase